MPIMPLFVFERRQRIERECGFMLAGQLIVGIPKGGANKKRNREAIEFIVSQLKEMVESNQLPHNAFIVGWLGGRIPENAADIDDDEIMAAWTARSTVIGLRLGAPFGHEFPLDSDAMAQVMGKPPSDAVN